MALIGHSEPPGRASQFVVATELSRVFFSPENRLSNDELKIHLFKNDQSPIGLFFILWKMKLVSF